MYRQYFTRSTIAALAAEFLGTMGLVMVALVMFNTTAVSFFVGTSVAVALGLMVLMFGPISGAHLNPAITFGLWTARRIASLKALGYIVVQLLAGLASWQLYEYLSGKTLSTKVVPWNTTVWLAEVIGTFVLGLAFAAAIAKGFELLNSALMLAGALFIGILIAATASAGLLNPAIALGLRTFNTTYVLGPLVGAVLGANLYTLLFAPIAKSKRS